MAVSAAILGSLSGSPLAATMADHVVTGACRDGVPNGAYELRMPDGRLRILGAFAKGRRTGTFLFWAASGARIAVIPYDDDAKVGYGRALVCAGDPAGRAAPQARSRLRGGRAPWRHPVMASERRPPGGVSLRAREPGGGHGLERSRRAARRTRSAPDRRTRPGDGRGVLREPRADDRRERAALRLTHGTLNEGGIRCARYDVETF